MLLFKSFLIMIKFLLLLHFNVQCLELFFFSYIMFWSRRYHFYWSFFEFSFVYVLYGEILYDY
jgi:hypothetical protein